MGVCGVMRGQVGVSQGSRGGGWGGSRGGSGRGAPFGDSPRNVTRPLPHAHPPQFCGSPSKCCPAPPGSPTLATPPLSSSTPAPRCPRPAAPAPISPPPSSDSAAGTQDTWARRQAATYTDATAPAPRTHVTYAPGGGAGQWGPFTREGVASPRGRGRAGGVASLLRRRGPAAARRGGLRARRRSLTSPPPPLTSPPTPTHPL